MAEQKLEIEGLLSRCTFPDAAPLNCAVSGGADSVAMLLLARQTGRNVAAFHVDHQIRSDSHEDGLFVKELGNRFDIPVEILTVEVAPGPNLEARARSARHHALPADVLFAHTADDQAETILLNLMRGSGLRGLSGISPEHHPILQLRRWETEAVCEHFGVVPRSDPTNRTIQHRRNRVRHELIPLLNDIASRDVSEVIARSAMHIRDDDAYLDSVASLLDPTDCHQLREAPLPIAQRAVRLWLTPKLLDGEGESHPPSVATVERVLSVACNETLAAEVGLGFRVRRSEGRLFIESSSESSQSA